MTTSDLPRPGDRAGRTTDDTPALNTFDPFDPAVAQCPFPAFAAMRTSEPVFHLHDQAEHESGFRQ